MAKEKKIKRLASLDELPDYATEISQDQAAKLSKAGFQCFVVKRDDGKDEYFTD